MGINFHNGCQLQRSVLFYPDLRVSVKCTISFRNLLLLMAINAILNGASKLAG